MIKTHTAINFWDILLKYLAIYESCLLCGRSVAVTRELWGLLLGVQPSPPAPVL